MKLVNGKGSSRVASAMGINFIEINRATKDNSKNLFEWRNNPKIREASRNPDIISWDEHQRWFDAVLADENRELVIGVRGNRSVGVVRFDIENDVAEVSIYLVPGADSIGYGRNLLLSSEQWLKTSRPEIKMIRASVLGKNEASKNLFLDLKYHTNTICYEKTLEIKND